MSELLADDHSLPTKVVIGHVQSALQQFVEKPEGYDFEPLESFGGDAFRASFEGLGLVMLTYNRRSQAHVSFVGAAGFEVNAGYRLRTGIWVEPIPYNQAGGLNVRYHVDDTDARTYYPREWQDGGFSFEATKVGTLHWHIVEQIGRAIAQLPEPVSKASKTPLTVVDN